MVTPIVKQLRVQSVLKSFIAPWRVYACNVVSNTVSVLAFLQATATPSIIFLLLYSTCSLRAYCPTSITFSHAL